MKVYLAWSGPVSKELAKEFESWLKLVLQHVTTFYSESDIDKGTRWGTEIARELETCNAGLLFILPENERSTWIHFEAGALSKSVESSRVTPILFRYSDVHLDFPLAQFQACLFREEDIRKLMVGLNVWSGTEAVAEHILSETFLMFWPKLELRVNEILAQSQEGAALLTTPPLEELMGDMLTTSRHIATSLARVELLLSESSPSPPAVISGINIGATVRHRKFGTKGVVKDVKPITRPYSNDTNEYEVVAVFPEIGTKTFIIRTSNLEIVDPGNQICGDELGDQSDNQHISGMH